MKSSKLHCQKTWNGITHKYYWTYSRHWWIISAWQINTKYVVRLFDEGYGDVISLNGAYGVSKNVDLTNRLIKICPNLGGGVLWLRTHMQISSVIVQMEVLSAGQVERQIVNYFAS